MLRFLVGALGTALLLSVIITPTFAQPPDPAFCSGPERICVSPKNLTCPVEARYEYAFYLRDNTGAPVAGFPANQVELRFTACNAPSTRPANEIQADGDSDLNGRVVWSAGLNWGGADPCFVDVLVQNTLFATLLGYPTNVCGGLRSPDTNGDGLIALADLQCLQMAFVAGGPLWQGDITMPFDCLVSLADISQFQKHFVAP